MTSILNLLNAIVSNPLVDERTKTRAGFLLWRLQPSRDGFREALDKIFCR